MSDFPLYLAVNAAATAIGILMGLAKVQGFYGFGLYALLMYVLILRAGPFLPTAVQTAVEETSTDDMLKLHIAPALSTFMLAWIMCNQ
jgi:hypothetical protein